MLGLDCVDPWIMVEPRDADTYMLDGQSDLHIAGCGLRIA
jgi:hypothetical protein